MGLRKHHAFMWDFSKSVLLSLRRPVFVYLTTISFTAIGIGSTAFYLLENGVNPKVTSWFDALYYTVTIMSGVGLGDIAPLTFWGRLLSMCVMLLGTAVFVCFTAVLGASILEIEFEHRQK